MKKVEIELTDQQEKFLKVFASKQYSGAKDNLSTCDAIHCVQTKKYNYFAYEDYIDQYLDDEMCEIIFIDGPDEPNEFTTPRELVESYYEELDEEPPIEIVDFDEQKQDYYDYFEAHGVEKENYDVILKVAHWEDVAFFWILDEAKKYLQYQKHNLGVARTYTKSGGYANGGAYVPFRNLLMSLGTRLNEGGERANERETNVV